MPGVKAGVTRYFVDAVISFGAGCGLNGKGVDEFKGHFGPHASDSTGDKAEAAVLQAAATGFGSSAAQAAARVSESCQNPRTVFDSTAAPESPSTNFKTEVGLLLFRMLATAVMEPFIGPKVANMTNGTERTLTRGATAAAIAVTTRALVEGSQALFNRKRPQYEQIINQNQHGNEEDSDDAYNNNMSNK